MVLTLAQVILALANPWVGKGLVLPTLTRDFAVLDHLDRGQGLMALTLGQAIPGFANPWVGKAVLRPSGRGQVGRWIRCF